MPVKIVTQQSFAKLRQLGGYYVDKTGFIENFFRDPADSGRYGPQSEAILFTRPRRFGKTLFMTMLAEFFDITKDSRELFAGLNVTGNRQLCEQWMNRYPVVFLTLKDVDGDGFDEAMTGLNSAVNKVCKKYCNEIDKSKIDTSLLLLFDELNECRPSKETLKNSLEIISTVLYKNYNKPVILLIDEYDIPVVKAQEKNYYDKMIEFMRSFLSRALKNTSEYLIFSVVTGCMRITKETLFSGLNNLDCYDISTSSYSDVFGFTQDEVDKLLADAGCEEKRETIKEWYDGYHFGKRQDIYCPWSIMKYLRDLQMHPEDEPQAYWVNTSGNELTKGFRGHVPASVQEDMVALAHGKSIFAHLNTALNYNQVYEKTDNFWTLLYLTGYLTPVLADNVDKLPPQGEMISSGPVSSGMVSSGMLSSGMASSRTRLAIPNKEVREAFTMEILSWFSDIVPTGDLQDRFFSMFWDGNANGLAQMLQEQLLLSTSFRDYSYQESIL